ncbi:MAG: YbgC/FadM family acyl-CoA thioesterase [Burkholderiaceae bacterium]|nr:YbgC/FadM family acyl-CoA thioesterase [Burkholderiaceae bacterium]
MYSTPNQYRLLHRLRVRWAEVDMQSIVFNAHYLAYLDVAITEYWRAAAMPFAQTMARLQGDMVVRKATVDFHRSARMDDWLDVGMRFVKAGRTSLVFEGAVFRGDELLATGELLYVFTTPGAKASQPVPAAFLAALEAFEDHQPTTHVHAGTWPGLQARAMAVREAVFGHEQGLPHELLHDAADADAHHVLLANHLGLPLASGRLVRDGAVGHIGRMAVLHPLRGQGLGGEVLQALVDEARAQGCEQVKLHALRSAEAFYRHQGLVPQGPPYEEAGLPHQTMVLDLSTPAAAANPF